MTKLIRAEMMSLRYSYILISIISAVLIIATYSSYVRFSTFPELITDKTPAYFTGTEMMRGEAVFDWLMKNMSLPAYLSILFAALFIGVKFTDHSIGQSVLAGNSRKKVFFSKIISFYITACFCSFLYPFAIMMQYSLPWFITLTVTDVGYVFRCIFMYLVTLASIMSISVFSAFLFKDILRSMATAFFIVLMISLLRNFANTAPESSLVKKIIELYPVFQLPVVMERGAASSDIISALSASIVMILVTSLLAYRFFCKAEL